MGVDYGDGAYTEPSHRPVKCRRRGKVVGNFALAFDMGIQYGHPWLAPWEKRLSWQESWSESGR